MDSKSELLMTEEPLIINKKLAAIIGLNESIIVQQIEYWININKKADKKDNYKDGFFWTYNSVKKWTEQFPFWSKETVKRILNKLREKEILITGNYNKEIYDKTLWYRINYSKLNELGEIFNAANKPKEEIVEPKAVKKEMEVDDPVEKESTKDKFTENEIKELWESIGLSKIRAVSKARLKTVNARVSDYGKEAVIECINNIKGSKFLKGEVSDFKVNFDWAFKPSNFLKILEGAYSNKEVKVNGSSDKQNNSSEIPFEGTDRSSKCSLSDEEIAAIEAELD